MNIWVKNNVATLVTLFVIVAGFIGNYYLISYRIDLIEKEIDTRKANISEIESKLILIDYRQKDYKDVFIDIKGLIEKNTQALNNNTTTSRVVIEKIEAIDDRITRLEEKE